MRKILLSVLSAALIICVWQLASLVINSPLILPSFFKVLHDFFSLLWTKSFYANLSATFLRVIESFALSLFTGVLLGFLCGRFEWCKDLLSFPIAVLRATPVVALILILVFSFSSASVPVAASVLMTLPIIITNISEGVELSLKNSKLNEMTRIFGFTTKQKIFCILLPKLTPYLKTSLLSSFGMTWKVVAAGEILSLPRRALGTELAKAQVHLETSRVLAFTLALILASYLFESLLRFLCREKKYSTKSMRPNPEDYMPEILKNESLALIAPSGFGKTTLLEYLSQKSESVSYSFQENRLLEEMTVFQNILLPLSNKFSETDARKRSEYYMEKMFIAEKKDVKVKYLSGGQKQRVALARALAFPSGLLLLDESFNAQDYELKKRLMEFIKDDLQKNPRTLIFVTHDERDGFFLCGRLIRLQEL